MDRAKAGFREFEHTADWQLHVWAPDLTELVEQAARGMYALSGTRLQAQPHLEKRFKIQALDPENLLVRFLDEILYFSQQERIGFHTFQLALDGYLLHAQLDGAPVESIDKEIKAVTYHKLEIRKTGKGLEVDIVFDV
ncbi:MAG: archease [Omnitrophica WOR_2 bacterium]